MVTQYWTRSVGALNSICWRYCIVENFRGRKLSWIAHLCHQRTLHPKFRGKKLLWIAKKCNLQKCFLPRKFSAVLMYRSMNLLFCMGLSSTSLKSCMKWTLWRKDLVWIFLTSFLSQNLLVSIIYVYIWYIVLKSIVERLVEEIHFHHVRTTHEGRCCDNLGVVMCMHVWSTNISFKPRS